MSDINRGLDHMTYQLRAWSPGQAMLPPDPNHHNRMLDRGAAEHLREVAPGLAPCLSCQAGLCAEHGPTVTATTTGAPASCGHDHSKEVGERDGITLEPRLLLAVPLAPAPPAEATNPVKTLSALLLAGSAKLVTRITPSQACDVVREIARQNGHDVVIEAPAPEAKGEQPCACAGHREPGDPLICRKRYSEMLEAIYEDDYGDTAELRDALLRHDLALRARASEAERFHGNEARDRIRAEDERDEARRMIAGVQPDDRAALATNILRVWPRAEIETFARHLLGDREQESLLLGQLQQQLEIVCRERDEAREQRDALSRENKGLRDQRDAISDQREDLANEILVERAARGKAEAENASLKTVAFANQNAAIDLTAKLAAAEARIARLVEIGDVMADPDSYSSMELARGRWRSARAAKADAPAVCKDGLPHSWGTDGQHANEFCKVCYVDRPKRAPAAGGGR